MKKLILILLIALTGCMSTSQIMNSYLGTNKQNLYMHFGYPTRISPDGAGGEILVYANQYYIPSTTTYSAYGNNYNSYSQSYNYWEYKMFFANSNGTIYHWLIQKNQIPPTEINLTIYKK